MVKDVVKKFITPDKIRFIIVGFVNTGIDFGIFMGLTVAGMGVIPANFISTAVAIAFSFVANKNYTFKSTDKTSPVMVIKFLAVTVISAWGLQPLAIGLTNPFLLDFIGNEPLANFMSKCSAVGIGLIWNYLLYAHFVFPKKKLSQKTEVTKED